MKIIVKGIIALLFFYVFLHDICESKADISSNQVFAVYLTWDDDPTRTMTVNWITTSGVSISRIEFRRLGASNWTTVNGSTRPYPFSSRIIHRVKISNLIPHTDYQFRIVGFGKSYLFRTMPDKLNQTVNFITGGDVAYGSMARTMNRRAAEKEPYFVVIGGDFSYADGLPERVQRWHSFWDNWYQNAITPSGRLIPIVPVIGNHEVRGGYNKTPNEAPYFFAFFNFPGIPAYNVLDFSNYLSLVVLDTEHTNSISGLQTLWLDNVLANRSNITHVFPVYHVPAYPSHRDFTSQPTIQVRNHWTPVFDKHKIKFAFENHDHTYKRTHPLRNNTIHPEGVVYIGDGAWGVDPRNARTPAERWYLINSASINHVIHVTIDYESVHLEAINPQGQVFDEYYREISQPVLYSPEKNAFNVSTSPMLKWYGIDNIISYRVQISSDPLFSTAVFNNFPGTDTLVRISALEPGKKYYWRVRAIRADREFFSSIRTFTTSINPPEIPQLSEPENNSSDLQPAMHFYWNISNFSDFYRLQISSDSLFQNFAYNRGSISDSFQFVYELNENSKYFWRVRASNSIGFSDWSEVFSFHTSRRVATMPDAVKLNCFHYNFNFWSENSDAGSYPNGMIFHTTGDLIPVLHSQVNGNWEYEYNLNVIPRFMGKNENGILLFNKYNPEMDDTIIKTPAAVVLNFDHSNRANLTLSWTNETYRRGDYDHKLRLQFRTGIQYPFIDMLDNNNQPVEYNSRYVGHSQNFSLKIPDELLTGNQMQFRWKFYTDSNAQDIQGTGILLKNIKLSSREKIHYSGEPVACENQSKNFQIAENNNISRLRWFFENQILPLERELHINATNEGNYFARIEYKDACIDTSVTVFLEIFPLPDVPEITVEKNLLISSATNGNQWYFNNTLITGADHYVFVPADSGSYHVVVTDENGCSNVSPPVNFDAGLYSFSFDEAAIIVFPNPNTGSFSVAFQAKENDNVAITVINSQGSELFRYTFISDSDRPYIKDIDITPLPDGIYRVNLYKNNKVNSTNVVVDKSTGMLELIDK